MGSSGISRLRSEAGGVTRIVALVAADIACVSVSWAVAVCGYRLLGIVLSHAGVATSIGSYSVSRYAVFWPVAVVFAAFNAVFDLYHGNWMCPAAPLSPVEEMRRLFGSSLLTHAAVFAYLVLAYQTSQGVSRAVVVISGLLVAFAAQSFRNWARALMSRTGVGQIPVVISGGGRTAVEVASALSGDPYTGFSAAGYFGPEEDAGAMAAAGVRRLGGLKDAVRGARRLGVRVLIACQDERLFRRQLDDFTSWFTHIEYMPSVRAFPVFGARPVSFGGIGGIEFMNETRMSAKRFQKRVMDSALALAAFFVALPAFVLIPVFIKLTSRGPVFYRHRRLGRGGREIRIWKFRSMYADADERLKALLASDPAAAREWEASFKLANDPRVTLFGRFLRRTSLDELPQLFNVFAGDMSLIGPRPIVEKEIRYYGDAYRIFASVRPGITGLWQVSGRSDTGYSRRVALDTYYVLNWSPWLDLWILVRTVYAVLFMRGAY